jgi:hypothetical protein
MILICIDFFEKFLHRAKDNVEEIWLKKEFKKNWKEKLT